MSKYNLSQLAYPSDVGHSPDLSHYVEFYINVRSSSKFDQNNRLPDEPLGYVGGTSLTSNQDRQNLIDNSSTALKLGGGLAGALGTVNGSGEKVVAGGILYATGEAIQDAQTNKNNPLNPLVTVDKPVRTSDVIVLHLQEPPSVRYNINYADVELGSIAGFLSKVGSVTKVLENENNIAGEVGARLLMNLAAVPAAIAGGGNFVQNVVGAVARKKINPFREVLFESVDYRTFNFRFRFMPKHEGETLAAKQIIDKFKFHMHPELSKNNFFYVYPSEFQLKYMYKGGENQYMNKIAQCALVDMQVEYGGDKFASFDSGAPVETIMTLTFRELVLHTKESIESGY